MIKYYRQFLYRMSEKISPKDILESARKAQADLVEKKKSKDKHALDQTLKEINQIESKTAELDKDMADFDDAIAIAMADIDAAKEAKEPVSPELQKAFDDLRAGKNHLHAERLQAGKRLQELKKSPEFIAYREKEQAKIVKKHQDEQRRSQEEYRAQAIEEAKALEDKARTLERHADLYARELTDLWKKDNGWALHYTSSRKKHDYATEQNALFEKLQEIDKKKEQLAALEGKWFKGAERKALEDDIAEEAGIEQKKADLKKKYEELFARDSELTKLLEETLKKYKLSLQKLSLFLRQNDLPAIDDNKMFNERFPFTEQYGEKVRKKDMLKKYGYDIEK